MSGFSPDSFSTGAADDGMIAGSSFSVSGSGGTPNAAKAAQDATFSSTLGEESVVATSSPSSIRSYIPPRYSRKKSMSFCGDHDAVLFIIN